MSGWWSDRRLVAGVVLIMSAFVGVVVFRGGGHAGQRFVIAAREISAGATVTRGDLATVEIATSSSLDGLVRAEESASLEGRIAGRRLLRGELLNRHDVAFTGPSVVEVSIPVQAEHVPSGLEAGDRIDVLATYGDGDAKRTVPAARDVEVVTVTSQEALLGGGAAGAVSAVTVSCDARTAALLVFAARSAEVDIVRSLGDLSASPVSVGYDDLDRAASSDTVPAGRSAGG